MSAMVMTVLGPVAPEAHGVTDAHTHAWIERVEDADASALLLTDRALLEARLAEYAAAGGSALVDCQPGGCGRNASCLAELSLKSGIHIVACTGFHIRRYYGPREPLWNMTADQAGSYFAAEIRDGLVETRGTRRLVRPGFIKIAAAESFAASPYHLFEAAAQASLSTGYAIEMHTERGQDVETILAFFHNQRVAAGRLVFCHMDKRPDFGLHRELVEEGVLLEYDTFFRPKYGPEEHVWPLVDQMLEAGLASGLALATDMAEQSMWQTTGPVGYLTGVLDRLAQRGVPADMIAQVVGGNIADRLATNTGDKEQ